MPNALVKSYAKKTSKSIKKIEAIWDEAKKAADKAFDNKKGPRYWAYVNGIVRKRLKLEESVSFKEYVDLTTPSELVVVSEVPAELPGDQALVSYAKFISSMFAARDKAHELHLATKSYAMHVALNDLYDLLLEFADKMAESFQGKHGLLKLDISSAMTQFTQPCEISFIQILTSWLDGPARALIRNDSFIINDLEELIGKVYQLKYKLENLK